MTFIHASIPQSLRDTASAAKRRGEACEIALRPAEEEPLILRRNVVRFPSGAIKKLPQKLKSTCSLPVPRRMSNEVHQPRREGDEKSTSKENGRTLSPFPVPESGPRKHALAKRPLSDLPCPVEPDEDKKELDLSLPEHNTGKKTTYAAEAGNRSRDSQSVERASMVDLSTQSFESESINH